MALTSAKMNSELMNLGLYETEPDAINAWTDAYNNFMKDAVSNGIPANSTGLDGCKASMISAMTGLSTSGAPSIQSGDIAYWSQMVVTAAAIFTASILIVPPPTLSAISAALSAVFANNVSTEATKADAMVAIANVLYTNSLGGTSTFPGAPPIVAPIL